MGQLSLRSAVGPQRANVSTDVSLVQQLLNKHSFATKITLAVDGHFGSKTLSAIQAFQKKVLAMHLPDGVVDVHGLTISRLQTSSIRPVTSPKPVPPAAGGSQAAGGGKASGGGSAGGGTPGQAEASKSGVLTAADYQAAAAKLGCEVAAIKAVAITETGTRGAFDKQGRPNILFERHYFSRLTDHIYDKTHPDISNKKQGGYGKFSEQYGKLDRAYLLDQDAALRSASWGAFQIMGNNYQAAGFTSAADFVVAMRRSVGDQLQAFVSFIKANPKLTKAIKDKQWATFAAAYNGPKYKENSYDTKLAEAYAANSK